MKQDILSKPVTEFISATAAKQPTPGGGSVAGVVGSLAVALGEMALNFTIGKKKFAEHAELHVAISKRLEKSRQLFIDLVSDDMQAFTMYCDANAMPDRPGEKRSLRAGAGGGDRRSARNGETLYRCA